MNAILLIDRHFVLFEAEIGDALLKNSDQEVVGELGLVREAIGRDSLKPNQEGLVFLVALGDGLKRVIIELIVVSVIAERRSPLWRIAEIRFVLFVEHCVLSGESIGCRLQALGEY